MSLKLSLLPKLKFDCRFPAFPMPLENTVTIFVSSTTPSSAALPEIDADARNSGTISLSEGLAHDRKSCRKIMTIRFGYKLMSEEHGAADLVSNAKRAERAGFDFAAISDHFSPWLDEQGHSPLAWPVLGAIANATSGIDLMTAVTCPIMRYHPAIIAQGAATLAI